MSVLEIVGYASSVLIAISLMMSNHFKLRIINFVGSVVFAIYGALLTPPALPVVCVNGLIACTNLYFLYKISRRKEYFRTFPIVAGAPFVTHFMRFYAEDIKKFFPKFEWEKERRNDPSCIFLLRGANPTGIFIYQVKQKSIVVLVDYVVPEYRDMKNADFLYTVLSDIFLYKGKTEYIVEHVYNIQHCKYLRAHGFKRDPKRPEIMHRSI
ncbi:MAG: hypothetical protein LBC99_01100 [Spirochaetota bacterium]|jgi:hypothetical protein|nr:hypothetical protein [Spirochaetota bacterium]